MRDPQTAPTGGGTVTERRDYRGECIAFVDRLRTALTAPTTGGQE